VPGTEVVVEEFLDGEEASFFALIDGEAAVPLASAQVCRAVCLTLAVCLVGAALRCLCSAALHT
jgi:hypothetical protein